ncbi:MAG: hypothetical protein ACRD3W_10970, partial [Terriglobales bacterium]
MASVTARTRTKAEAFLLAGTPAAAPMISAVPKRLFTSSKEQLRITLYSLLFLADCALIALAFLGAGAIRLGSPFEAQSLRTVAVVIPTFIAIAAHNRAYSIRALQRPAHGAVKVAEALGYAIAVAIALLFYTRASIAFSREIFAIGTMLALLLTVAGRLFAGAYIRNAFGRTFVNRLVILDEVNLPTGRGEVVVSARELGIV